MEPFLKAFVHKIKSLVGSQAQAPGDPEPCHSISMEEVRPILVQTLQQLIQRIAYPEWFQHNDPLYVDEERHLAFLEFRESLSKIFRRILLVDGGWASTSCSPQ